MDATAYFTLFAQLLKTNPPTAEDAPMVATLAKIGIVPGQDFDASKLDPAVVKGLAEVPKPAQRKDHGLDEGRHRGRRHEARERLALHHEDRTLRHDYRQRALVTAIGLGANRPQDAVYPTSEGPDALKSYDGAKKYVMHFNKGELPPVDGFWSLTMYDANYFFVPNPINRYTVSQRNKLARPTPTARSTCTSRTSRPARTKEQNWLPAPKDKFILMMRLYWPKEKPPSLLDGTWKVPGVEEAS